MSPSSLSTRIHVGVADVESSIETIESSGDSARSFFVVPKNNWEESVAHISQARATTLHNEVLVHVSHLSPLGITALLEMLSAFGEVLSTAQLYELAVQLEDKIQCFALLKSVAKLQVATPSMFQHIMSWLPSSRFIAEAHGSVLSMKKSFEDQDFLLSDEGAVLVCRENGPQADPDFSSKLTDHIQPSTVIYRQTEETNYWGAKPEQEWCLAPADLGVLTHSIQEQSTTCTWCNEPFVPPHCPVCSATSPTGDKK